MSYLLTTFLVAILSIFDFFSKYYAKIFLFLVAIILIFFCSLRDEVGLDDLGYKEYFIATNSLIDVLYNDLPLITDRTALVEPLFLLLTSISKVFSNQVNILFFFAAIISIFLRYSVFVKFSPYPILSFLIYASHEFYVKDWTQIRNGLASVIVLFALNFLIKKNYVKFIVCIFIAAGFHLVSILALILIPFSKINFKKKHYLFLIFGAILISIFFPFKSSLMFLADFGIIPYRVSQYFFYEKYAFEMRFFDPIIVKGIGLSLISIYLYDILKIRYPYYVSVLNYQIVGTCFLLVFRDFSIMAVRANGLFYSIEPLLIVLIAFQFKQKFISWMIIILYSFLWVYYDQFVNPFGLPPYKSILQ